MRVFYLISLLRNIFSLSLSLLSSVFVLRSTITDIPNASNAGVACFETKDYHTVFFDPDRSMRLGAAHEGVKSVGI